MLAKIWKKLLLAICIIACIFNVMNKIIKHTSLDTQLKSIIQTSAGENDIIKEKVDDINTENNLLIKNKIKNNESYNNIESEQNSIEELEEQDAQYVEEEENVEQYNEYEIEENEQIEYEQDDFDEQ